MAQDSHVRQVLDMLKEGKITVDEADRLIQQVASTEGDADQSVDTNQLPKAKHPKFLRICVEDQDDTVDVRVPLKLLKFGLNVGQVLPEEHRSKIEEQGVDFGSFKDLSNEDLAEALEGLSIDVNDASDSSTVRVYTE